MNRIKMIGAVLIVAGVLGLMYDRFTYIEESHDLEIGSLTVSVKDRETVDIPLWCSLSGIAVGLILLLNQRQHA